MKIAGAEKKGKHMRKLLFLLLPILIGCLDIPTGFTDYIEERTVAEEVFFVNCAPLIYDISLITTGTCEALNADSTLLQGAFPRWVSSCPACILVDEFGGLTVGDVAAASVTISAFGPNNSGGISPVLESIL